MKEQPKNPTSFISWRKLMDTAKMVKLRLMRYVKMLARYLLCLFYFNNLKEFQDKKFMLTLAKEQLWRDCELEAANVEAADDRKRKIMERIEPWHSKAQKVLEAVFVLENGMQSTSRLNWIRRCFLSDEMEALKQEISNIVRDSQFEKAVFQVNTLWENESSRYFMPSKSLKSVFLAVVEQMKHMSGPKVITVYGQRGVGKSTLVELVEKLFRKYLAFKVVVVSQSTNDIIIQKRIAEFLKLGSLEKKRNGGREEDLRLKLKTEKRILIILDDFCKEVKLESLGITDHPSCKILVMTSDEVHCSTTTFHNIKLEGLNEEEAWNLMEKYASPDASRIKQVAKQIAHKCRHSPIAVTILGRALRGEVRAKWSEVYQSLTKLTPTDGESKNIDFIYSSVNLIYEHVKDDGTRKCFLLCSLFPKDNPIALQDLKRYAWGLRIYPGIKSIEDIGIKVDEAIKNLKESFLLLPQGNTHVQMQNVVHEAALQIAFKDDQSLFRIKPMVGLWERPNNREDLNCYTAISFVPIQPQQLYQKFRSEKLEIMYLGGAIKLIHNGFLKQLETLKVLAIHCGNLSLDSLQNLTNLQALHLEQCQLNGLISSIGKLKNLEILSFRDSDISELRDEIENLNNLRLLDLFGCKKLRRIPLTLIRKLSRLEELYFSGHSFEEWWSEENRAEGSNITAPKIILPSSLTTQKTNDERSARTISRPLKIIAFLPKQSKGEPQVEYLDRDHILWYDNHVVPNLVQSVRRVIVMKDYQLKKAFRDGRILHTREEESGTLLSDLTFLELEKLRELSSLRQIWQGKRQTNHVSLQNPNTLIIKSCNNLQYLFSVSLAQSFEQLKTLEIHSCKKLEHIVAESRSDDNDEAIDPAVLHSQYFPQLSTLLITGCEPLESIFQIPTDQRIILGTLRLLEISNCPKLEQIFRIIKVAEDKEDIEIPHLEQLALKDLMYLKSFRSGNGSIKLPLLQDLEVGACHELSNASMMELIGNRQLKKFCLFDVGNQFCEDIFKCQDGGPLSCVQKLTIKDSNELYVIWKEPTQVVNLQNLTLLEVVNCSKLKNIFSLLLARNLLQLCHLVVQGCKELLQIFPLDEYPSSSMSQLLKPVYFPNLMDILIEDCNKLRSLFPASVACLPKLEALEVRNAPKLVQVFGDEGDARVKRKKGTEGGSAKAERKKEIVELRFPKLNKLHLKKLTSLESLNPVDYCKFPVLNSLKVKECKKLVTIFEMIEKSESDHTAATVYAKNKETFLPERVNYNKSGRYVALQEIQKDKTKDINWSFAMKVE